MSEPPASAWTPEWRWLRLWLLLVGVSLAGAGLLAWWQPAADALWQGAPLDQRHQLRAIHGLYLGLGVLALLCAGSRALARVWLAPLALLLAAAALGRLGSWLADGPLPPVGLIYLLVEAASALAFLLSARRLRE